MSVKTILIVDDSAFDRNLLKSVLSRKGSFRFLEGANGADCLKLIESDKPDLVVLDVVMPGELGIAVLKTIRNRYMAIELPVIMATAKAENSDVIEALKSGANDYITKPINFEVAFSRINTHLALADASKEMSRLKEVAALDALVRTYHHEINNPLTVAVGLLDADLVKDGASQKKLKAALWRVVDVVKKIRDLTENSETEYRTYAGSDKIIKIR